MHLFIIGAPASGKMTIGQELSRLTDATLFYNHQAIDFALEIYQDFTEEMWEFVRGITFSFLGASARNQRSVILTDVIDFSNQYQLLYLKQIQGLLNDYHQEILFVELETSLEERIRRNRTENRLKHKPLKRHIEVSEREILETAETLQLNSQYQPNELHHYFKINNIRENGKIRYFFCGEYGPRTLRPHYHAIIWFDSETLSKIFEQLLLKSWSLGFVDFQFVNSSAPQYVAKYVAGAAHLPEILQYKSTRLFHLQSKAPIIGYTNEDGERFQKEVINGNYGHVEYDTKKQTSVFVAPPLPLENRYFPKCREYRFNSRAEKLRIYAFAYDIATEYKIDGKELSDIIHCYFDSAVDIHCMYACKHFCETYNSTPERYVDLLLAHYDRKAQYQLRTMYEYQIDYVDKYRMPLYHLLDFDLTVFERLPHTYNEFKKTKLNYILNSYGLNDEFIRKKLYRYNGYYGPEAHQLNHEVVYSLHQNTSSFYLHNLDVHKKIHEDSLKVKKKNELLNVLKIS